MKSGFFISTTLATLAMLCAGLSACGGGGGSDPAPASPPSSGPTEAQRIAAATTTANNHALCTAVAPFYWELGNRDGARASGSVSRAGSSTVYTANTSMALASATNF